jgi:hypothetical protein
VSLCDYVTEHPGELAALVAALLIFVGFVLWVRS